MFQSFVLYNVSQVMFPKLLFCSQETKAVPYFKENFSKVVFLEIYQTRNRKRIPSTKGLGVNATYCANSVGERLFFLEGGGSGKGGISDQIIYLIRRS